MGAREPLTETLAESAAALVQQLKPRLRGWLHLVAFPLTVIAGIVLVALAPAGRGRIACAIFAATAAILFGTSALYHRGHWSPSRERLLKRIDHSNIFLIIAGSYTPFAVLLLPHEQAKVLLAIVWSGALLGVAFRVFWVGAPRWLYTPAYIALGWTAVFYLPDFAVRGGAAVLTLVIVGGVLYTLGGIVYGIKRPNPLPRWFGFHEVFHALTVAAFTVHLIGVFLAAYSPAARGA
ncbi:MAG: hemolysin III family protein [Actinobacteria bacterium]|uniref:Hemolysin III family protein n=1 Tax=Nostocoides veronense TaxID=330836 RepID=A0ABN2M679_9MICO|nr:hemolysin III family protein [Actinomycetota bacterium]